MLYKIVLLQFCFTLCSRPNQATVCYFEQDSDTNNSIEESYYNSVWFEFPNDQYLIGQRFDFLSTDAETENISRSKQLSDLLGCRESKFYKTIHLHLKENDIECVMVDNRIVPNLRWFLLFRNGVVTDTLRVMGNSTMNSCLINSRKYLLGICFSDQDNTNVNSIYGITSFGKFDRLPIDSSYLIPSSIQALRDGLRQ